MPWFPRLGHRTRRDERSKGIEAQLAAPLPDALTDLDLASIEVVELDAAGRVSGVARWKDDDSLREPAYAAGTPDAGSLAGVWDALGRAG